MRRILGLTLPLVLAGSILGCKVNETPSDGPAFEDYDNSYVAVSFGRTWQVGKDDIAVVMLRTADGNAHDNMECFYAKGYEDWCMEGDTKYLMSVNTQYSAGLAFTHEKGLAFGLAMDKHNATPPEDSKEGSQK